MYTLALDTNFNTLNNSRHGYGREPVTYGSARNDSFLLDDRTRGAFFGGAGDDTFTYNKLGHLNTSIYGGRGEDTLALQNLQVQQVLQQLLDNRYSFVQQPYGFSLRTPDGQEIRVADVEKVAFADRTFDLRNDNDVNDLVNALRQKQINVIDESNLNYNQNYSNNEYGNLIPVNIFNSGSFSQSGSSGLFNNVWPQALASSSASASASAGLFGTPFQQQQVNPWAMNSMYQSPFQFNNPNLQGFSSMPFSGGFPMNYGSFAQPMNFNSGFPVYGQMGNWGGLSGASANGNFDFRNSNNTFNIFNGPVSLGSSGVSFIPVQPQSNYHGYQSYHPLEGFSPNWNTSHLTPVASSYSYSPRYSYHQPIYTNYSNSSLLSSSSSAAVASANGASASAMASSSSLMFV